MKMLLAFQFFILRLWSAVLSYFGIHRERTVFIAETNLPTHNGVYRVRAYRSTNRAHYEPQAIIFGNVEGAEDVPIRVHDACFTSEVIGSKKCDCKEQLDHSMSYIRKNGPGMVIYLQQEGRGIGLSNKIAAYSLQETGLDTVEANRKLNLPDDCRTYDAVIDILRDLNIQSVQLLTNNPRKIEQLGKLGVKITSRVPIQMEANTVNLNYLKTKASKMSHLLNYDSKAEWSNTVTNSSKSPAVSI